MTLRAPIGKRTIVNGTTQTRYALGPGGGYFEQPATTGTTQPPTVPAACTAASYEQAVRDGIDGGLQISDEHCQGAFLRLSYRQRQCAPGACADDHPTIAYFVAIDRRWHVVTLAPAAHVRAGARRRGRALPGRGVLSVLIRRRARSAWR